jgi:hypothetical protein
LWEQPLTLPSWLGETRNTVPIARPDRERKRERKRERVGGQHYSGCETSVLIRCVLAGRMKSYALAIGMTLSSAAEIVGLYRFQPDATTFRLAKCVSGHLTEKRERRSIKKKGYTHTQYTHRHTHKKENLIFWWRSSLFGRFRPSHLSSVQREREKKRALWFDWLTCNAQCTRPYLTHTLYTPLHVCVFKYSVKAKKRQKELQEKSRTNPSGIIAWQKFEGARQMILTRAMHRPAWLLSCAGVFDLFIFIWWPTCPRTWENAQPSSPNRLTNNIMQQQQHK